MTQSNYYVFFSCLPSLEGLLKVETNSYSIHVYIKEFSIENNCIYKVLNSN